MKHVIEFTAKEVSGLVSDVARIRARGQVPDGNYDISVNLSLNDSGDSDQVVATVTLVPIEEVTDG